SSATAQNDTARKIPTFKVGIFAPLYLDSVFTEKDFRPKQGIPRFIMPAVDFVQGVQVALDSMPAGNENIEASIYDSKAFVKTVPWLISNKKLDSLNLIIGSVKDVEYKQLADFALQKKIPFISATYPNDGGITGNPYVVIMNPTLRSHCEAIYSYILQNHGTDKIYLCRKPGAQEDQVAQYLKQINEQDGQPLLHIQTLNFDSPPSEEYMATKLDSNSKIVIIGGSLEETFASELAAACAGLNSSGYKTTLIGMPTWDGFASLHKKDNYLDYPIYFTSPYWNNKWDDYSKMVMNAYQKKYKGKPSDMAFKGFESIYLFTKLLAKYPTDLMDHINDRSVKIFNDYNFRPVMLKKDNATADYVENKHLYFIKILNGAVSKAW
ncbi:MAG TPA: ABC transporter substrate-binding protein, partial [Ferruginibacter sp.]|nr:ABC transporter substrate-binding protein [Ferruginibacter sp.]